MADKSLSVSRLVRVADKLIVVKLEHTFVHSLWQSICWSGYLRTCPVFIEKGSPKICYRCTCPIG